MMNLDDNWITTITHSPMYPLVLLTVYVFGIGFTIGNYVGFFRYNKDVYGDSFIRAYLAFTILGAAGYFFVAGVAWLWAAKYVATLDSRIRKLTVGFVAIFLFHDLPVFSMECDAILQHGWRNGYQGFCFVFQLLTFLLSFTNAWLYFTWVCAGQCQLYYGYPHEVYGLKTGAEHLEVLPPMSPTSPEGPVLRTPMLGSGLRWGGGSTGGGGMSSQPSVDRVVNIDRLEPSRAFDSGMRQHSVGSGGSGLSASNLRRQSSLSRVSPRMASPTYSHGIDVGGTATMSNPGSGRRGGGGGGMHMVSGNTGSTGNGRPLSMRPITTIDEMEERESQLGGSTSSGHFQHQADPFDNPPSLQASEAIPTPYSNKRGNAAPRAFDIAPLEVAKSPSSYSSGGSSAGGSAERRGGGGGRQSWRDLPVVGQLGGGGQQLGGNQTRDGPIIWNRKALL